MSALIQDIRHGARMLRRQPGTSAVSVLTLALGIGLTAAMFSIVYGVLHRSLPFPEPERLVALSRSEPASGRARQGVPVHDLEDWRAQQSVFTGLAAYSAGTVSVSGPGGAERFEGGFVSANTFDVLRARPLLGRAFREGEDRPGAEPVIILGYDVWQTRYDGDPQIIGRTVRANGEEATVVGVMPDGFHFPMTEDVWVPLRLSATMQPRGEGMQVSVLGRLRPDATLEMAGAQMTAIARRLALEHPEVNAGVGVVVQRYADVLFGGEEVPGVLYTMLGAVFLVLLIACSNVANLLLSRAVLRAREVGIRTAMGASRRRVAAQFLAEPLALAGLGALGGVGLAWAAIGLFNRAISDTNPPYWIDIRLDGAVLLFVLALTLFATLASGVLPALRASGSNTQDVLKDESRGSSTFRLGRASRALVVFQIALSCGLLVAAGLTVKSVAKLRTLELGFDAGQILTAGVELPMTQFSDSVALRVFYRELTARLGSIPGADAVALATAPPGVGSPPAPLTPEGAVYASERDVPFVRQVSVTPGFFGIFDTPLLQGRDFGEADHASGPPVAIVNHSLVRRLFPDGQALGRRVRVGRPGDVDGGEWRTIVGVVPDLFADGVEARSPAAVYLPLVQHPPRFVSIVVRTRAEPAALTAAVRGAVSGVNADVPLTHIGTLAEQISRATWFYRVFGTIFVIFGVVALFLAAVGLYGVMAFSVSRRTREMGVRLALGAQPRDVTGLVLRQGAAQIALGLLLGVALAAGVSRLIASLLFRVDPRDPAVFAGIVVVLTAAGLLASWIPARRATRVDPMVALRSE